MAFNRKVSVSQREVTIEGFLKTWTGYMSRWKKTYVMLRNGVLLLGRDKTQVSPLAHLDICSIYPDPKSQKNFIVEWGAEKVYLRADSPDVCLTWLETLSIATQLSLVRDESVGQEKSGDPLVFTYQLVRMMHKDFGTTLEQLESEKGLEAIKVQEVFDLALNFQVFSI